MTEKTIRWLSIAFTAALLVWGIFSLLAYLGVPVHDIVLTDADNVSSKLAQLCPTNGLLCRGAWAVPAVITYFFSGVRLGLLAWFIVWAFLLYGLFIVIQAARTGDWSLRLILKPWHLLAVFLIFLWLLFEVASRTLGTDTNPMRILYEPLPQVYTSASPAELQVLKENETALQARGCLTTIGQTSNGAAVYQLGEFCVQEAFITRVLPPFLFVLLLAAEILVLGSAVLRFFRFDIHQTSVRAALSLGLGAGCWAAVLWLLAQVHLYSIGFGWALFVIVPAACYKEVIRWWTLIRETALEIDLPWWSPKVLLLFSLIALLALNFLSVVRPFPIGWDDLGRYINSPRLLVSYGQAIPTMGTFQWEYLTSLGFLLFGYGNPLGATVAMETNWLAGLLAVFSVFVVSRRIFGGIGGVLAAALFYATPVIGHFSFADMKPDNAVFALGTLALFAALLALYPSLFHDEEQDEPHQQEGLFLLAGVLAGFALGFKATEVMVTMAIAALVLRSGLGIFGFLGTCALAFAAFIIQGSLSVSDLSKYLFGTSAVLSHGAVLGSFLVLGVALLLAGLWKHRGSALPSLKHMTLFILGFIIAIAPWAVNNAIRAKQFGLLFSPPNTYSASFQLSDTAPVKHEGQPVRTLPKDLQVDLKNAACVSTAGAEELDRYWGTDVGFGHYLLLPWRSVLNLDAVGYYVTMLPGFLLFPLLLLAPAFWWKRARVLRALFYATAFLIVEWIFLANGVPWYGVGMFLGIVITLEALTKLSPNRTSAITAWTLIVISLCCGWAFRLWQLDQQRSLLEYPIGKVSADVLQTRTIGHYDDVKDTVLKRAEQYPKSPYVYRMGTFIPYFIPKNLELLPLSDNQLDVFNCLNQEQNHALTLKRLQALGFSSMIFDTNTATIESDPNGTLHKKVNALLDFLNDKTIGLDVVVNDASNGIVYVLLPTSS